MVRAYVNVTLNNFSRYARTFPAAVQAATQKAVQRTIEVADPLTPVDTGALRANKTISVSAEAGEIHWAQEYAGYQNYGTSRGIAAKHFVDQGVEAGAKAWEQALAGLEGKL